MSLHQFMIENIKKINKKSVKKFIKVLKKRDKTMADWDAIDEVVAVNIVFSLAFLGFMFFLSTGLLMFGVVGSKGFEIILMCSLIPMLLTFFGVIIEAIVIYSNPYD